MRARGPSPSQPYTAATAASTCVEREAGERREPEARRAGAPCATRRMMPTTSSRPKRTLRPATCSRFSSSREARPDAARAADARSPDRRASAGVATNGACGSRFVPARSNVSSRPSTASRNAARTPCASSTASPAAVVPPGEVTAARSDSGVVVAVAEQGRRAEQRLAHQLLAGVARQPDEHARFDHRLGDAGTRTRDPSPRARSPRRAATRARAPRSRPRRARARRPRGRARSACVPAAIAAAPRPTSAPVLGIARTTGRPGDDGFERGDGDAGRDREHQRALGEHLGAARERLDARRRASPRPRAPRRRRRPTPGSGRPARRGGAPRARGGDRRRPRRPRATRPPSRRRAGRRRALRPCAHRRGVPGASEQA